MSQSHLPGADNQGEPDPLLAFNAEFAAAESPEKHVDPPAPAEASPAEDASLLRPRLEQAERSLDRARIEIASLKSDLATLVTAVDDIKKRLSRRPEATVPPPVAKLPQRNGRGRPTLIAILFLTLGVAFWGAASVAQMEIPLPAGVVSWDW